MYHVWRVIALIPLILAFSCKKEAQEKPALPPHIVTPYNLSLPPDFPPMVFRSDNTLTEEGVALGRMLYYDPILHPDSMMACASCHKQQHGFTLPGTSALPHINLGWNSAFLWGGASGVIFGDMESICLFEVEDFFKTDIQKLAVHPQYRTMFWEAFGVEHITSKEVAFALAQFMRTQVSGGSRFDHMMGNYPDNPWPTEQEMRGYEIFFSEKGDCFHCHGSVFFTDNQFHNTGLDSVFNHVNQGLFLTTGNPTDLGKFKTPTLRNVALRNRFMHDGRFQNLEEVIRFYNKGVNHTPTLDPIMSKPGKTYGLGLSEQDIDDLVAFLNTLTDTTFINNSDLSDPFR